MWIFESKGACWRCHTPGLFTDEGFHNTGVGVHNGQPEPGRAAHSKDEQDRGRFKTPTLRGLRLTAPYMHDGSLPTLVDVVEFYDRGGNANPQLDPRLQPLHLTAAEKQQLVAFLTSL
jgi:cytochrome c peroxidase